MCQWHATISKELVHYAKREKMDCDGYVIKTRLWDYWSWESVRASVWLNAGQTDNNPIDTWKFAAFMAYKRRACVGFAGPQIRWHEKQRQCVQHMAAATRHAFVGQFFIILVRGADCFRVFFSFYTWSWFVWWSLVTTLANLSTVTKCCWFFFACHFYFACSFAARLLCGSYICAKPFFAPFAGQTHDYFDIKIGNLDYVNHRMQVNINCFGGFFLKRINIDEKNVGNWREQLHCHCHKFWRFFSCESKCFWPIFLLVSLSRALKELEDVENIAEQLIKSATRCHGNFKFNLPSNCLISRRDSVIKTFSILTKQSNAIYRPAENLNDFQYLCAYCSPADPKW